MSDGFDPVRGVVTDFGGGQFTVMVDRDTREYPTGDVVVVAESMWPRPACMSFDIDGVNIAETWHDFDALAKARGHNIVSVVIEGDGRRLEVTS